MKVVNIKKGLEMNNQRIKNNKPDYGIDAPNVVRNLFAVGIMGLLLLFSIIIKLWSGIIVVGPIAQETILIPMAPTGFCVGVGFISMAIWMLWSSKIGKIRNREKLLDNKLWKGNETVLDIGCGRGLMLIGAAKRLDKGKAIGIDIWQSEDLSGNNMEATIKNISLENVEDRTEVKTADMRQLPFSENTFDVVLSCSAIHNLYSKTDRAIAISEIVRVLKPGGQALIDDIRYYNEYKTYFLENGCKNIKKVNSLISELFVSLTTMGTIRPVTMIIIKAT